MRREYIVSESWDVKKPAGHVSALRFTALDKTEISNEERAKRTKSRRRGSASAFHKYDGHARALW